MYHKGKREEGAFEAHEKRGKNSLCEYLHSYTRQCKFRSELTTYNRIYRSGTDYFYSRDDRLFIDSQP